MEQMRPEPLPPVRLYAIGPQQAEQVASLLTAEAANLLRAGQAFGLAAVEEGEARGAACARLDPENDICMELVSLYVAPQYRRRRLGGTLLLELLEACGDSFDGTVARVEASFLPEQGLEALLSRAGFQLEREGEDACSRMLSVSELADSPLMKHGGVVPKGHMLTPLEKLSHIHIRQLSQALEKAGADYMEPQQLFNALPGVSFVLLDANRLPAACAVLTGQEDRLCLSQFFAAHGSAAGAMAVLRAAAGALVERYPGARLEIPLLTRPTAKLVERLLGSAGKRAPLVRAVLEL